MKHKAKSFIAVLLALCLMMSLGVGALAVDGSGGSGSGPALPDDVKLPDGGPGDGAQDPSDQGGGDSRGGDSGKYTITVQQPAEGGGEVKLNNELTTVAEGMWVSFTAKPSTGYKLVSATVTPADESKRISLSGNGTDALPYKFQMPACNVTISAEFAEDEGDGGYSIKKDVKPPEGGTVTVLYALDPGAIPPVVPNPTTAKAESTIFFSVTPDSDDYELAELKVTPDEGEVIPFDTETPPTGGQYSFTMPASDVTISAVFQEKAETPATRTITVTSTPQNGGTLEFVGKTLEGGKTTATVGEEVTFTVKPNEGYELVGVVPSEALEGAVNVDSIKEPTEYYFDMPNDDVTIAAIFRSEGGETTGEHSITANVTPAEGGTVELSHNTAAAGTKVTFTVKPNPGYEMDGNLRISGLGSTIDNRGDGSYTFTMEDEDVTISVAFKQVAYAITVTQPAHGKVSTAPAAMAAAGTPVTLTAVPDEGYELVGYTVTKDGGGAVTVTNGQFTMPDSAVTVTATFKLKQDQPDWSDWHKIDTWSNSVDGGISCDADMALAGSEVTFRVWHNYKYDYYDYDVYVLNDRTGNRVSLDYSAYDDEYSFTMPDDDVTIYVYFDYAGRYSITKDVEGDGSIYVRSSADKGDTVWIEASPNAGQSLTSLRVFYGEPWAYGDKGYYGYWDEAEVKYSTYWDAYYFTMPAADVVVYARFTDGATVDVITGDHGDAKVSSRYAEKGDWVYITAYPDEGYEVDSVTVTDSLGRSVKVTELSYDYFLFTMPGTNVDVKVTFRAKDYDVFYDVSRGDWYYKAVRFVHEKGIMEGTGTHYFSPEADLSRGMLATILYRLEGSPAVSGYSGFTDVADTAYYAKAVAWAKANGIVNGVTATAYEPDTAVTREELAAILCRYAAFKGKDTAISYDYLAGFSDANTSHVYARPALNWAVAYDIINGQGNGVLAPRATATRAEVAQVLMNYLEVFD